MNNIEKEQLRRKLIEAKILSALLSGKDVVITTEDARKIEEEVDNASSNS